MTRFAIISLATLLGASAAYAAGVNDVMPNGQQGQAIQGQAIHVEPPSRSTAVPNASGEIYRRQLYYGRIPRVHNNSGRR